jgi:putative transposase
MPVRVSCQGVPLRLASLNSQARQAAASRAWFAIECFYEACLNHKPGKKGHPRFQHDNRSVEVRRFGAY